MEEPRAKGAGEDPDPHVESSAVLLARARNGDERAWCALVERYRPHLMRMAHGQIPQSLRGVEETADLVARTFASVLGRIHEFHYRGEGALLAYLRTTLFHLITDEYRSAGRRPVHQELPDGQPGTDRTPLEIAIGREVMEAYLRAVEALPEYQRRAVFMRVELSCSFEEIGAALNGRSAGAARQLVVRGLEKLAVLMREHRESS